MAQKLRINRITVLTLQKLQISSMNVTEKKAGNLIGEQLWRTSPKNKMSEPAQRSVEHKNLLLVLLA